MDYYRIETTKRELIGARSTYVRRITDITEWSRFPEVAAYADSRGITVAEAIETLVNRGLSHT